MSLATEIGEPESRFADVAGCRLHYQSVGDGPTVVCLHGGGPGATGWTNFSRNVDGLARRFRLLLVDFPGFGRSTAPAPIPRPLEFFAEVVEALIGELGIDRAHFIGNSTGGGVSIVIAAHRPELVDRLVLMGTAGYGSSLLNPSPSEGVRLIRSYYPGPSLDKMRWLIKSFVYDSSGRDFEDLVRLRYEASLDPALEQAALERGQHSSLVDLLPEVAAETLLIWGREDRFVPLEHALGFLGGIRNSRLVVFPRCGHWVMAERVEEFNHHVVDFLTRDLEGERA
ncbi:MAG TPA: alpha/beta fold hydrolase [Actinomycetota bacterium]